MSALDLAVVGAYVATVLALGWWAARGPQDADSLLLAGRKLPIWAALCSLAATELSAATFVGVPHAAFTGDWSYLELAFGALLGKLVLSRWVVPLYHQMRIRTVYGFLAERFGARTHRGAALCFVAGRLLASGARLFIAALALSLATSLAIEVTIALAGLCAAIYVRSGGLPAVVWTDVLQGALFIVSAVALLASIGAMAPGGWQEILAWGAETERTRIFHLTPLFAIDSLRPLGAALVGGFALTLATHATDHDMVQRLLATRSGRDAGFALAGSGLLNFPLSALFLAIGTGLAFLAANAPADSALAATLASGRDVVPLFALEALPSGLRGLFFAGLAAAAMSSLDSAIAAISATWVVDVAPGSERTLARRTRRANTAVSAALIVAAWAMAAYHGAAESGAGGLSLIDLALSAMSVLYGGLLGVFAAGLIARRRGADAYGLAALALGSSIGLALFLHPLVLGTTYIAWGFWIPLAATPAALLALAGTRTGHLLQTRSGEPTRHGSG